MKSFDLVGKMQISSAFLRLLRKPNSPILLQRGIAGSPREAAALPGRFLPELGRFLGSGHFFIGTGLLRREFVARAHVLTHAPRDAPAQITKSIALDLCNIRPCDGICRRSWAA